MDKKKRNNLIFLVVGIVLVIALLLIYREGLTWLKITKWSRVSVASWISISVIFSVALVLQYYYFILLRYSIFKYLVLWLIPIIWLFNNGLVALHRFFNWTTDIVSPVGWLPLGELLGGMLSIFFVPVLLAGGAIVVIIDSTGLMLTQACYYAGIALDVTNVSGWNILSYSKSFINVIWDLLSNSFVQQVTSERLMNRPFLDLSLSSTLSLPYWVLSIGYSFTCVLI
jgi:hypothetical protein